MTMIQLVTFDKENEAFCGVVAEHHGARPCLHLLELAENKATPLNEMFLQGCQSLRDQFFPHLGMNQIDWTYTNGICHSDISFEEQGGAVTRIHLNGNHLGGRGFKLPLKFYNDALASPDGFEHELTSGHGFIRGGVSDIYPVPVSGVPQNTLYFKPNQYEGMTTILVDAKKFVAAWREQESAYIRKHTAAKDHGQGKAQRLMNLFTRAHDNSSVSDADLEGRIHDFKLFESSVARSREEIWKNTSPDRPMPTAFLNYDPANPHGAIAFMNGRHRVFNTANLGAPYMAVEVSGDIAAFHEKFAWTPPEAQHEAQHEIRHEIKPATQPALPSRPVERRAAAIAL